MCHCSQILMHSRLYWIMEASTIDEVIDHLDQIIDHSYKDKSRLAYFPILYKKVTVAVKEAIEKKEFEDNETMERLDVVFANRYLKAYSEFLANKTPSSCWLVAFEATDRFWPLVVQQLLLGINAHINLDLGIAAAEIAPGHKIHSLKTDFYKINSILSSMVEGVQTDINKISPIIGILDFFAGKLDERIVDFSIEIAREGAWDFALEYAFADERLKTKLIQKRDKSIAWLGRDLRSPGLFIGTVAKFIRIFETKNVRKNCDVLIG